MIVTFPEPQLMGNIPGEKSLSRVSAEPKIKDHMTGSHCRLLALTFFYLFSMELPKSA